MNTSNTDRGMPKTTIAGIGIIGFLTIIFTVLRVYKVINWSWIWVLSPIWISFLLLVLVIAVVFAVAIIQDKKMKGRNGNDLRIQN